MQLSELDDYVVQLSASEDGQVACALASNSLYIFELEDPETAHHMEPDPKLKLCAAISDAHGEIITGLDWASQLHGRVFATCSLDGSGSLWREATRQTLDRAPAAQDSSFGGASACGPEDLDRSWIRIAHFAESQTGLLAVKFCNHRFGLRVAFCAEDGSVLVYSAADPGKWDEWLLEVLTAPQPATADDPAIAATCLGWTFLGSPEGDHPWLIVGGSDGLLRFWKREPTCWQHIQTVEAAAGSWVSDLKVCPPLGHHLPVWRPTFAVVAQDVLSIWTMDISVDGSEGIVTEEIVRYIADTAACRVEWWPSGKVLSVGFADGVFETLELVCDCKEGKNSMRLLPMAELLGKQGT